MLLREIKVALSHPFRKQTIEVQHPSKICLIRPCAETCLLKKLLYFTAMGISILSYNGHVKMGIIVDRSILSNPSVLVNNFVEQVNQLAKLLRAV